MKKMFGKGIILFLFAVILHAVLCSDDFLLYTDKAGKIFGMDIATQNVSIVPVTLISNPIAIDFDFKEQTVYWSDNDLRVIRSVKLDGTSERTVRTIPGSIIDGLAVDSVSQLLFYTDTGRDVIDKLDLVDGRLTTVIDLNVDQPRGIVLDIKHRNIYWSDWGSAPKIETAAYDGFGRRVIINTDLTFPNAIAVDVEGEWLYWADVGSTTSKLEKSKLDGSSRQVLRQGSGHHYYGLTLYQDKLYFTDWKNRGVFEIPTAGGEAKVFDSEIYKRLNDICVYQKTEVDECLSNPCQNGVCERGHPGYTCKCRDGFTGVHCETDVDECSSNPCRAGTLCEDGVNRYSCICPVGFTDENCNNTIEDFVLFTDTIGKIFRLGVSETKLTIIPVSRIANPIAVDYDYVDQTIYWTDVTLKEIRSIKLNGTSEKTLRSIPDSTLDGIAVDPVTHTLFYTDAGNHVIEKINLDDESVTTLISTDLDKPRAIVLDTKRRTMYWSDWGEKPKIETAAYDGHCRRSIISTDLTWPNAIAVDFEDEWIYWADTSQLTSSVGRSKLDGSRRQLIYQGIGNHFFGMAIYDSLLLFTDWKHRSLVLLPKVGGSMTKIESILFGRLNDIHVYKKFDPVKEMTTKLKQQMEAWNRMCVDGKCFCIQGFYSDGQLCARKVGIGQPCNRTEQCEGTNVRCDEKHGACLCQEGFYLTQVGQCLEAQEEMCEAECSKKCISCVVAGNCEECPESRYGPRCTLKRCPFPKDGPLIPLPKAYFDVGESIDPAEARCPPGLALLLDEEMMCLPGGVWSVEPVCTK